MPIVVGFIWILSDMFHLSFRVRQWRQEEYFSGGPSHFSQFFPIVKCIFPVEISILLDPKQISGVSQSEKQAKEKKSPLFICIFFSFHFQFSTFPFTIPLLFLSIFPCISFPGWSVKISRWKLWGGTLPPCPPVCYATGVRCHFPADKNVLIFP